MCTKRLIIASIATLALSLSGYTVLAEPSANPDAGTLQQSAADPGRSLTFVRGGHGGGHGGGGSSRGLSTSRSTYSRGPGSMMMNRRSLNRGMMWDHSHRRVHRHHFRHRRFVNGVWVWVWDDYDYGGSCYSNCLEAGYSPRYCSRYADNFC
jgi:hypothetical protein